jgi:hypothetical protein
MPDLTGPLAGEPRERPRNVPAVRRAGAWLVWWVVLMSFWVIIDDSVRTDELLAGAVVAALAATLAELVTYQAATRFRMRLRWLVPALRLPGELARDMLIIYRALWRRLVHGDEPPAALPKCRPAMATTRPRVLPGGHFWWAGPVSRPTPSCSAWTPGATSWWCTSW